MLRCVVKKVAQGGSSAPIACLVRGQLYSFFPKGPMLRKSFVSSKETMLLLRGCAHARNLSCLILPGGSINKKETSENFTLFGRHPSHASWNRSLASDSGDLFDAVVPFMGESITDGTLATFLKKPGDKVEVDETIAQIETDKVTIDVASPEAGVIQRFVAKEGDTVVPGTKIAVISRSAVADSDTSVKEEKPAKDEPLPQASTEAERVEKKTPSQSVIKEKSSTPSSPAPKTSHAEPQLPPKERERRVPMTRLRKRVATRLKDSQNTYAMLTTFNEVDMTNLMQLRSEYKDLFLEKHGVKLGFMSGFVKAVVSGLQHQPIINAVIDGEDIIYRDDIDISIAVGTPKKF